METLILAAILLLVLVAWLALRKAGRRRLAIESPRLGLINLMGDPAARLLAEDRAALVPLFGSPVEMQEGASACDVLFVYCEVDSRGEARESPVPLREILQRSGARVIVFAAENAAENYGALARQLQGVNVAMTLERKGTAFPTFFARLFSAMFQGTPMPVAWNQLAPQAPGQEHADCPDTYCIMGAGQLVFRR